jgi:hypothetical protein
MVNDFESLVVMNVVCDVSFSRVWKLAVALPKGACDTSASFILCYICLLFTFWKNVQKYLLLSLNENIFCINIHYIKHETNNPYNWFWSLTIC